MNEYIVFDLETTGLSTQTSEIIEIGAWHVKDFVAVDRFQSFVKPRGYLPLEIRRLTGIEMSDLEDAEPVEVVLAEFYEFCGDYPFLGYNLQFDYNMLVAKGICDFTLNGRRQGIDAMKVVKKCVSLPSYSLRNVVDNLGVRVDGSFHRALYDAYMTKLVYEALLTDKRYKVQTLPELLTKKETVYGKAADYGTLSYE